MSSPVVPVSQPPIVGLHTRRCARHTTREAAARCPTCGEFFCRECVVEHEGKLLCAPCLARATAAREKRQHRWALVRRTGVATAGVIALWACFQIVGSLLLKVPPAFHDGSVWKRIVGEMKR